MARVLLISLVYEPDMVSTATLVTDIARGLAGRGHHVTVLTTVPHFNPAPKRGQTPFSRRSLKKGSDPFSWLWRDEVEDGVRVIRVLMPRKGRRVWSRVFDYALFQLLTSLAGALRCRHHDVVFVVSPPIMVGLTGVLLSRISGAKFIYGIQELWPDVPAQMGMIRSRPVLNALRALESFVYRNADAITTIARGFSETLAGRGVPAPKLHFIPNFVDTERLRPSPRHNPLTDRLGLRDAFVVTYAGNIGLTQGLDELIVGAARAMRGDPVRFLVIGNGVGREQLDRTLAREDLPNVVLLPFQPADAVNDVYGTSDVCLAPLRRGFARYTAPSKVYTIMACGRPAIVSAEEGTDTARLVEESGGGLRVAPESVDELVTAVRRLSADPAARADMGRRAREWIVRYYSRDAILTRYDELIRRLAPDHP